MDIADQADRQIEESLASALALSQSLTSPSLRTPGYSIVCEACCEPIPPARIMALPGCATCVDCARILEQADRLRGKDVGTWWW